MRVVLTLLVRDEIDVIEGMLDFHFAQGVDYIIVTDNGSTDGTLEICREYAGKERVELLLEPPSDFSQHRWVSRMANVAYEKYAADWIIHADADELFVPAPQHRSLKDALKQIPAGISNLQVSRHDFVPIKRPMKESPHVEMVFRKTISLNLKGLPLPPKVVHRGSSNVRISQGNHSAVGDDLGEPFLTRELSVYHYPIRSFRQFKSKVHHGGSGYAKNLELAPRQGYHKRFWYDLLIKGRLREAFENDYFMGPVKLAEAVKRQEIVEDQRIADFFKASLI